MKSKDTQVAENTTAYEFEEFLLDGEKLLLWRGSEIISLSPKACEVLHALVKNSGRVVTKQELLEIVWGETFVEEANLTHHVSTLRRILGEEKNGKKFIETIPRRGYRFVAPLKQTVPAALEITVTERRQTKLVEEIEIKDEPGAEIEQSGVLPLNKTPQSNKQFPKRRAIYFSLALISILGVAAVVFFKFTEKQKSVPNSLSFARLTNSGKVGASSISPDGKFVAYIQNYTDGIGAIYLRQIDTNIEKRLATHEKGEFGTTAFSPDGAFVFYIVRDAFYPDFALYRISILDGAPIRLSEKLDDNYFSLSPDGSQAVVTRHNDEQKQSNLIAIKLDGSGAEQILMTRSFQEMRIDSPSAWSPDGQTIAVAVETAAATKNYSQNQVEIMLFDLSSKELRNFSREFWSSVGVMRWMPDASGVVVIGRRPGLRNQIYFVSNPAGIVSRITNDTNGYGNYGLGITADGTMLVADVWEFQGRIWGLDANGDAKTAVRFPAGDTTFSGGLTTMPDGHILYSTRTSSNVDLWTLSETDTEAKPLTSDAFHDSGAVVSPDGNFIVFVSDRAGNGTSHLFRMNMDGSRIEQLTFGEGIEDAPDISPDGAWIIFHSNEFDTAKSDWKHTIRKIPSTGGTPVHLHEECFAPAFSPDGNKFSCITPTTDNYRGKIVVAKADDGEAIKIFDVNYFFHTHLPARWTPDGTALVFRSLENQTGNLWEQNLSGGAPVKLTDFKSEVIFNFVFSRDGKRLLISRGNAAVNVVIFKNFK